MHFSTKEELFIAAVPGTRDLAENLEGDPDGLPHRVAASFVRRMELADSADPFIALVRTAASDEQAAIPLLEEMWSESLAAYRRVLDGPDLDIKVDLIGALLIGITFSRYVVRQGPLATMQPDALVHYLTNSLREIMSGQPPAG